MEIILSVTLCVAENKEKTEFLKDFLESVGEGVSSVWSSNKWFRVSTVAWNWGSSQMLTNRKYKHLSKAFKNQFHNSIRLICYLCIILIVIFPFILVLLIFNHLTSWLLNIFENRLISISCRGKRIKKEYFVNTYWVLCYLFHISYDLHSRYVKWGFFSFFFSIFILLSKQTKAR